MAAKPHTVMAELKRPPDHHYSRVKREGDTKYLARSSLLRVQDLMLAHQQNIRRLGGGEGEHASGAPCRVRYWSVLQRTASGKSYI